MLGRVAWTCPRCKRDAQLYEGCRSIDCVCGSSFQKRGKCWVEQRRGKPVIAKGKKLGG